MIYIYIYQDANLQLWEEYCQTATLNEKLDFDLWQRIQGPYLNIFFSRFCWVSSCYFLSSVIPTLCKSWLLFRQMFLLHFPLIVFLNRFWLVIARRRCFTRRFRRVRLDVLFVVSLHPVRECRLDYMGSCLQNLTVRLPRRLHFLLLQLKQQVTLFSISTAIVLNSAVVSCCSIFCLQITAAESNPCRILSKAAKVVS